MEVLPTTNPKTERVVALSMKAETFMEERILGRLKQAFTMGGRIRLRIEGYEGYVDFAFKRDKRS